MLMFLFFTCPIRGQKVSPDDIKAQLKDLRSNPEFDSKDTINISLINDLCFSIQFKNLDTVLILGKEALKLSKLANYKRGEAASLGTISNFFAYSGELETAIQYADSVFQISIPNDFYEQSTDACNTLGVSYFQLADYPNSYKYFLQGSEYAKKINDKSYIVDLYMNIGTMYSLLQDYEEALIYYDKSLLLANEHDIELTKWKIKSNIAYLQSNIGLYDNALKNINESIDYFKGSHLKQWLAFSYTTKGDIYLKKEEYENSHIYFHKAKAVHKILQDGKGEADVVYGLAASYVGLNEFDYAEKLAKQSLQMYQKIHLKTGVQKAYTTLYNIYDKKNNSTKALHFLKLAGKLSDTIATEVNKTNLKMLRTKLDFQTEKELLHEQSDLKIEKQRSITRWVILALFGSILFGYIILNANKREKLLNKDLNRKRTKLELRELQLREINTTQEKLFSIVGHDLKGPISSLHEILKVMTHVEDKEVLLKKLLPKLNNYTSHVHFTLDNLLNWGKTQMQGENVTPSSLNIHAMASDAISLSSEALLKKEITVELDMDKEITAWADKEDINVVFRNVLSNAIKFSHSKGLIKFSGKSNGTQVIVEVEDNGVGMNAEAKRLISDSNKHYSTFGTNNEKGTGLGLMLCNEIITRNNGKISIESSENNGSKFTILLTKTG